MTKRIMALDYMRILGMLAVVGIHIGALTVSNADFPISLFVLYEVFSRYGIPIFFFISGFGIFRKISLNERFNYTKFTTQATFKLILTYVGWCAFYSLYFLDNINTQIIIETIFSEDFFYAVTCGYAGYHLYFMLLLIIFYLLMPLWIAFLKMISRYPTLSFAILFSFQLWFNKWGLHNINPIGDITYDKYLQHQVNWICIYYISTFMLGAYIGNTSKQTIPWLIKKQKLIFTILLLSILYLTQQIYLAMFINNLTLLELAYTLHQLSSPGWFYCTSFIVSSFIFLIQYQPTNKLLNNILNFIASSSNIVYFIHPVFLYHINKFTDQNSIVITAKKSLAIYLITIISSLLVSFIYKKIINITRTLKS